MRRVWMLAAIAALLAAAPAEGRRTVPGGWLGVMAGSELTSRPSLLPGEFALMARSGVEAIRVEFNWESAQPSRRGGIDFSTTDAVVAGAALRGLRVLPVVLGAPRWASSDPKRDVDHRYLTPRDPATYDRYLVALIRRYGPRGSLWHERPALPRVPIRTWQVWNEPILEYFWNRRGSHRGLGVDCAHQPWAPGYAALLRSAARAIRRADPRARVMLAGFPNFAWSSLCALYRVGARRSFDSVALHPYTAKVSGVFEFLRRVRAVMRRHGDPRKPVYLTELSWPAARGRVADEVPWDVTPAQQVRRISEALPALARRRGAYRIGGVYWYTWMSDFDATQNQPFRFSGLRQVEVGGLGVRSRPGLAAYRRAALRLEGRGR
jgi:polysaccharide biosynthesis protein PslG